MEDAKPIFFAKLGSYDKPVVCGLVLALDDANDDIEGKYAEGTVEEGHRSVEMEVKSAAR